MSEIICEALLEMHFHQALVNSFKNRYGANFLKLLKPSPQQEAWVGFDQGWARTSLTTQDLYTELKNAIQDVNSSANEFYFGFFLQFKVVERMARSSRLKPDHYTTPYYRSELSLYPNPTTGISQHETLLRLNQINGASVSYACGMLFDIADIWEEPDLARLRCIDISTSPQGWATNQRHFIAFQTPDDPSPFWCSDPVKGRSMSFDEWAFKQEGSPKIHNGEQIIELIENTLDTMRGINAKKFRTLEYEYKWKQKDLVTSTLPPSFTIIKFEKSKELIRRRVRM